MAADRVASVCSFRRRARRYFRGFSLIELLVVVAIITVLLALTLPALSVARRDARTIAGLANLRQIGQAIHMYAMSWENQLPVGYYQTGSSPLDTDWGIILQSMLSRGPGPTRAEFFSAGGTFSAIFTDPNAALDGGRTHYSAHPVLMPDLTPGRVVQRTYHLPRLTRPADVLLVGDGAQDPASQANAHATLFRLDGVFVNWTTGPVITHGGGAADNAQLIASGPNVDEAAGTGHLRFRQAGERAANMLFSDSHAATVYPDEIRKRNVRVD